MHRSLDDGVPPHSSQVFRHRHQANSPAHLEKQVLAISFTCLTLKACSLAEHAYTTASGSGKPCTAAVQDQASLVQLLCTRCRIQLSTSRRVAVIISI